MPRKKQQVYTVIDGFLTTADDLSALIDSVSDEARAMIIANEHPVYQGRIDLVKIGVAIQAPKRARRTRRKKEAPSLAAEQVNQNMRDAAE